LIEAGNTGQGGKSEVVFGLLQMDMFECSTGYMLKFETFYNGHILAYTTPYFAVVPTHIEIQQPLQTQPSISSNIFRASAEGTSAGSREQCALECLTLDFCTNATNASCSSYATACTSVHSECIRECVSLSGNNSLATTSCYEGCVPTNLSACLGACDAADNPAPVGEVIFEEEVGAILPEIRVALKTFHFARALVGEVFRYTDYSGSYAFPLADGLYTLDTLNTHLAAGFESAQHPPDALSFHVDKDRVQAKIRYEGFNFALAGTGLGALLGFTSDLPANKDLSTPGTSVFTAAYTRSLLTTQPAASENASLVYHMPAILSPMAVSARLLDRADRDVTRVVRGPATQPVVEGVAALGNLSLHAAGSFQVVMVPRVNPPRFVSGCLCVSLGRTEVAPVSRDMCAPGGWRV
jgi:hypothetical protein